MYFLEENDMTNTRLEVNKRKISKQALVASNEDEERARFQNQYKLYGTYIAQEEKDIDKAVEMLRKMSCCSVK